MVLGERQLNHLLRWLRCRLLPHVELDDLVSRGHIRREAKTYRASERWSGLAVVQQKATPATTGTIFSESLTSFGSNNWLVGIAQKVEYIQG